MGTRNLTMVISKGETKVAQYGQWDGYPSGQGLNVLSFARLLTNNKEVKNNLLTEKENDGWARENIKSFLALKNLSIDSFVQMLDEISFFTNQEHEELSKEDDPFSKRPYLSRDTASNILYEIVYGNVDKISNSENFASDSLFCEWAYVIDLDKETFEVYQGFNKKPLTKKDRFFKLKKEDDSEYYPIKLMKSYDLNNLPTENEFLKLEEEEEFV
jgi:hypothetical protein